MGRNSILCLTCKRWIHHKCSGIKGQLSKVTNTFKCPRCHGKIQDHQVASMTNMIISEDEYDVVPAFCHLGDMIGQSGGCEDSVVTRIRSAWKHFHELLPILTDRGIPFRSRGHVYNMCVRSVLLYASETWPLTNEDLERLRRNDNAMVRWICSKRLADRVPMEHLHHRLGIHQLEDVIRWRRLR